MDAAARGKGEGCVLTAQAESAEDIAVSVAERGSARATGKTRHLYVKCLALFKRSVRVAAASTHRQKRI